jgi:hypothetical protein
VGTKVNPDFIAMHAAWESRAQAFLATAAYVTARPGSPQCRENKTAVESGLGSWDEQHTFLFFGANPVSRPMGTGVKAAWA